MNTVLQTDRLIIRPRQEEDTSPMVLINQDPKVMRYFPNVMTSSETQQMIDRFIQHEKLYGFTMYPTILKSTNEFIGFVGLMHVAFEAHFTPAIELAWRIATKHQCQGYATEAAKALLLRFAHQLNDQTIVAFTPINNLASQAVMKKLSMTHDIDDVFAHPKHVLPTRIIDGQAKIKALLDVGLGDKLGKIPFQ